MAFGHLRQTFAIRNGTSHQPKCEICLKSRCTSKHLDTRKAKAAAKPVLVTHIAGYVPPKGSIAQQFFGHVVHPL